MSTAPKPVILFDGECGLCNSLVRFITKRNKKQQFNLYPLQSKVGQQYLERFGLSLKDFSSFVYIKDEKHYLKSEAALRFFKDIGGWWKFLYVFIRVPKPIRDLVYDFIAKNRYRLFGKENSCSLPVEAD